MKKILITGAQGFLGVRAVQFLQAGYEVCAVTHADAELTNEAEVQALLARVRPDVVFHTAAVSDTAKAQQDPAQSLAVNVHAPTYLARACAQQGAKLVAMSSDQVYFGCTQSGALAETVPLAPVNVYGQHKLQMESAVLAAAPDAVLLRLTWLFDVPDSALRQNSSLPVNLLAAARENRVLPFPVHEVRGVTDVWDVVRRLPQAASLPGGVYNFGSENTLDSYRLARFAAAALGLPDSVVQPDEQRFAPQGRNLAMDTARCRGAAVFFPPSTTALRAAAQRLAAAGTAQGCINDK